MSVIPSDLVVYSSLGVPAFDGSTTVSSFTAGAINISGAATNANSGFPAAGGYPAEFAILNGTEIIWVTQGTSGTAATTFTGIRGFAGTTAASAASGATITMLTGGPPDFLSRVSFTDFTSNDFADVVSSSGADVSSIALTARNPGGSIVYNQLATLNNTTPVTGVGAQQYERFLAASVGKTGTLTAAISSTTMTTATVSTGTAQVIPMYALMGREIIQLGASASGTAWTGLTRGQFGTVATLHNSGDSFYVLPKGDVAVYMHTAIESGTCANASSGGTGTTPPLIALQSGQGAAAGVGTVIRITGAPGTGQLRYVVANTGYGTDVVAVNRDMSTALTSASTYSVYNGFLLESVTSAGTGTTAAIPVVQIQRAFWNDSADVPGGALRNYYQKMFQVNNNTVTDFTNATMMISGVAGALPTGASLTMALTNTLGDSGYIANRQAGSVANITSYAATGVAVSVPGAGTLTHSSTSPSSAVAQGAWLNLTLVSGTAAYKGAADIRVQGTTT